MEPYHLSTQLLSDASPVRCVTLHSSPSSAAELLSGSQDGLVSKFALGDDAAMEIQPGGSVRHPHQITAILSSSSLPEAAESVYATGCKDGIVRVMDGATHAPKLSLEGHANAVTSLAWVAGEGEPWLASGSWDGTARIWDISTGRCLATLEGHENTVSVAGLPPVGSVRRVATASAGAAAGGVVGGHAVRVWNLSSAPSGVRGEIASRVSDDHAGPMRDVRFDPEADAILTCSNDGTVKVRSSDGRCAATLAYPNDSPMLLSLCVVGSGARKAVVAGSEDGNVVIWDASGSAEPQVVPHPGCVWKVSPLPDGEFVTACHDGYLRIFSRDPSKRASEEVLKSFEDAVNASRAGRAAGPSAEEIEKLPKWEMNSLTQGRSEGQVMVFNKGGKAIAAQWSSASRTWIEVGEVTGQADAGTINGKSYDHVLPIEIDVQGGGVRKLQIGYNNGENPFVVAQNFIDEHMLDQGYLSQIADYIRQRAGETGPTLGMGGSGGASSASGYSEPTPMETAPTYQHLPARGYKIFDAGVDKKGLSKILSKISEFNSLSNNPLSSSDSEALESLCNTLSVTNRYHSSSISNMELMPLHKMIREWDASRAFPALDLARMAVLHPDAAKGQRMGYWKEVLDGAMTMCLGLEEVEKEVAVPMLTMRLVCNCYKGGSGGANAAEGLVERILKCIEACALSNNKNVRLAIATALLNTASHMHSSSPSSSSALRILDIAGTIAGSGKYEAEPIARVLVALGTILLIPSCGEEAKAAARERGMLSMLERVASGNDVSVAVAKEIRSILS